MLIRKSLQLSEVSLKVEGDTGQFSGYASVFNGVDSYGDTIAPGAFADSLKEFGMPKMFFNHEWGMPIGRWLSATEDAHGLHVKGELTPGLQLATDVRAAMKHGTLDGLSIGGMLRAGDYEETASGGRLIKRWSRLMEVSPVVFPADNAARIDLSTVKNTLEGIETVADFETFLRDAGGFSRDAAKTLICHAKKLFSLRDAGETDPPYTVEDLAALALRARSISLS